MTCGDLSDEDKGPPPMLTAQYTPLHNQSPSTANRELSDGGGSPLQPQQPLLLNGSEADIESSEDEDPFQRPAERQPGPSHHSTPESDMESSDAEEDPLQLQDSEPPSHTTLRRATRHDNTNNKLQDWTLSVKEKHLIIGDSNLAKFPSFHHPDLQIDSYPGATFYHAEALVRNATCSAKVETVVLAFSLNNRNHRPQATTIKQLEAAVSMTRTRFPGAEIFVPLINFSPDLPPQERENIKTLNMFIEENLSHLTKLPSKDFKTEGDLIHWTHDTASKMLYNWIDQLN